MSRKSDVREFRPLRIAVLTVTESRSEETDEAGSLLIERLAAAGHRLAHRRLVAHDRYRIRAVVSSWIASPEVQVVLTNGGTGLMDRNVTPEAIDPLLDRALDGFGELFRSLSYRDVKTSSLASRALAGVANTTLVFCMPGSPGACRTAWDEIIEPQLDYRNRPCNLAELVAAS